MLSKDVHKFKIKYLEETMTSSKLIFKTNVLMKYLKIISILGCIFCLFYDLFWFILFLTSTIFIFKMDKLFKKSDKEFYNTLILLEAEKIISQTNDEINKQKPLE